MSQVRKPEQEERELHARTKAQLHAGNREAAGEYTAALGLLRDREEVRPRIHANLAQALTMIGDYKGAEEQLTKAVQARPNDPVLREGLNYVRKLQVKKS